MIKRFIILLYSYTIGYVVNVVVYSLLLQYTGTFINVGFQYQRNPAEDKDILNFSLNLNPRPTKKR